MGYVFTFTSFEENSQIPLKRYEYSGSWSIGTMENLFNEICTNAMKYDCNISNYLIFYTNILNTTEVKILYDAFHQIRDGSQTTWCDEYSKGKFECLYEIIESAYSKNGYIKVELD